MRPDRKGTLLALAAALVLTGCAGGAPTEPAPPTKVEVDPSLLRAGQMALEQRRFDEAARRFRRALQLDPDHAGARLGLAESELGRGKLEAAEVAFEEAGVAPENEAATLQGLGIVHLLAGDGPAARPLLLEATRMDPAAWRAWNALAVGYDRDRRFADAGEAYARALATAPDPAVIHNNWGMSLMAQSDYEGAERHFREALHVAPEMAAAETNLRMALAAQERFAEALSGTDPEERAQTLNNIGFVALSRGDHERAEAYFQQALESSPHFYTPAAKNLQLLGTVRQIEARAPPPPAMPDAPPTVRPAASPIEAAREPPQPEPDTG